MRKRTAAPLAAAALVALVACSKKPTECREIIAVIDDDDQKIAQLLGTPAAVGKANEIAGVATALATLEDTLAADLAALKLTVPEVQKLSSDYQGFAHEVAAAARETATVMNQVVAYEPKVDPQKPDGVPQKMKAAAEKMTNRCTTKKSTECVKLFDKMKKILADADKATDTAAQAAQLDAFVAELSQATLKDAELKTDLDEFIASMKDASAVLHEATDLTAKMTTTKATMDGVLAKERPLTASINAACVPQQLSAAQSPSAPAPSGSAPK